MPDPPTPTYKTTRSKPTLLNHGTKQPLQPSSSLRPNAQHKQLNPSAHPASVTFRSAQSLQGQDGDSEDRESEVSARTQEVDMAGAVQQFLDPVGWDGLKRVGQMREGDGDGDGDGDGGESGGRVMGRKEAEEEERRRKEREAEFGGMAVRARMRVR